MAVQPTKLCFTVNDYYRMAEAGIFAEDARLELVNGEVIEMTPIGSRHAACVKKLTELLYNSLSKKVQIGVQDPILLNDFTEVRPDISLLRRKKDFYAKRHPNANEVYLVIEIADTSITYDRSIKLPLYAQAGIAEIWIIDLQNEVVEISSDPDGGDFLKKTIYKTGESVRSNIFPELIIPVNEILIKES